MARSRHTVLHTATTLLSSLLVLIMMVACGGATPSAQTTVPTTAPAAVTEAAAPTEAVPATTEAPASGETAAAATEAPATEAATTAPATEAATAAEGETATEGSAPVAAQPTGVPEVTCQSNQKAIVWMVRNSPVENAWETNIVRPAFAKAHPEICLKILSLNQDDVAVKREAMIAAGEQLDVWSSNWGGNGFANDLARGLIADLTPLIQRDNFDTSVFLPDALATYQRDGKTWGLPLLATGSYLYYNMKLFDEAKVEYPPADWDDTSWTWDKFVDTAKKLTKNVDNISQAQFGAVPAVVNGNLEFPPLLWGHFIFPDNAFQQGYADHINVTDDASVKAYQAFHDLVFKEKVAPDPSAAQALDQLGGSFATGKVAMQMDGGWGHWVYKSLIDDPNGFCWGAAPFPMATPDAKIRSMTFTDPWVITAKLAPEEQDLAWTFLQFLVSPEQAAAYTKTTGTPPTQKTLLQDYYKQFSKCQKPEDAQKAFEGAFTHGRPGSLSQLVHADELSQIWTNSLSAYFSDPNGDTATTLKQIEEQTDQAEAQIKSELGQ